MKALSTLAVILLFAGATAASAGEPAQKQTVKKTVKIDKQDGRAWLGVSLGDRTEHSSESTLDSKKGAVVKDVVHDSPADSIGLKEDDIIIELNGKAVTDAEDVVTRIGAMKPGEKASIVILRDDAKKTFSAVLGSRPRMQRHMEMRLPKMQMETPSVPHGPFMMNFDSRMGVEGMKLMELRDQLGKYFEAPDGKALLVTEVKKNSNARKAGIEAGDVITKIGTTDIEDMSDLHQALRDAKEDTTVAVEFIRKGVHKTVKLQLSAQDDRMMFNFGGSLPHHQDFKFDNFNLDGFNFDHEQWRDMLKDLRPQLDQLRKQIRIRVHGAEANAPIEIEEETEGGTEL